MLGRPQGRNTLIFTDLIEVWTWIVVVFFSSVAIGLLVGALVQPLPWSLVAVPAVLALMVLHWLLLWRVLLRRRWACMFSSLYGWLFFYPYPGLAAWWHFLGAALLTVVAASVVAGWRELTDGW